jgi:hypothetical protein
VEEELTLLAVQDQAAFGGQDYLLAAAGDGPTDDLLRPPETVDGGRVDQGDALVQGGMDCLDCLFFVRAAPHPPTDGPGTEAHS